MGISKASAQWSGGFKTGAGTMKPAHAEAAQFSVSSRFEGQQGSNPEELIGAAHAGCFTMQLSALLGAAGFTAERLHTTAKVYLEKDGPGFSIPRIELELEGKVPGLDAAGFQKHAETAKASCPVSKALAGTQITLKVKTL
jgi:osmotically inducible protein OsmC